eukprot:10974107-Lingulodinium_polyedra.AAC.1
MLKLLGATVKDFDVENDPVNQDLAAEEVWDPLLHELQTQELDVVVWAPPCSTFSSVRARKGSVGPRPVRTASGPGRYGLSDLYPSEKDDVRLG